MSTGVTSAARRWRCRACAGSWPQLMAAADAGMLTPVTSSTTWLISASGGPARRPVTMAPSSDSSSSTPQCPSCTPTAATAASITDDDVGVVGQGVGGVDDLVLTEPADHRHPDRRARTHPALHRDR